MLRLCLILPDQSAHAPAVMGEYWAMNIGGKRQFVWQKKFWGDSPEELIDFNKTANRICRDYDLHCCPILPFAFHVADPVATPAPPPPLVVPPSGGQSEPPAVIAPSPAPLPPPIGAVPVVAQPSTGNQPGNSTKTTTPPPSSTAIPPETPAETPRKPAAPSQPPQLELVEKPADGPDTKQIVDPKLGPNFGVAPPESTAKTDKTSPPVPSEISNPRISNPTAPAPVSPAVATGTLAPPAAPKPLAKKAPKKAAKKAPAKKKPAAKKTTAQPLPTAAPAAPQPSPTPH